jgi:hypothetical protein
MASATFTVNGVDITPSADEALDPVFTISQRHRRPAAARAASGHAAAASPRQRDELATAAHSITSSVREARI